MHICVHPNSLHTPSVSCVGMYCVFFFCFLFCIYLFYNLTYTCRHILNTILKSSRERKKKETNQKVKHGQQSTRLKAGNTWIDYRDDFWNIDTIQNKNKSLKLSLLAELSLAQQHYWLVVISFINHLCSDWMEITWVISLCSNNNWGWFTAEEAGGGLGRAGVIAASLQSRRNILGSLGLMRWSLRVAAAAT